MAAKQKTSEEQNLEWLLPAGLAAVVGLLAIWFVGGHPFRNLYPPDGLDNDRSAQVVEVGLSLSCVALLGWGWWLASKKRNTEHQVLRDRLLVVLGFAGFLAYFNFGHLHFNNLVHVWDTYHYHIGAKYFPELNYERLYDCSEVVGLETGRKEEIQKRTITNLRNNLIEKTDDLIANPDERCKRYFTPERWEEFKGDINTYRSWVNEQRWTDIMHDHGYNATPVWTLGGLFWTNTLNHFEDAIMPNIPAWTDDKGNHYPSSAEAIVAARTGRADVLGRYNEGMRLRGYDPPYTPYTGDRHVILLNLLDPIFWVLTSLLIWWAFGPRAFAVAAIVMGCNFPNRFYWTGGAFLRHDWIFFFVASICLLKKDRPYLAGASFAYATLLRLFPGLAALGPALAAVEYWRVHRKLDGGFLRYVAGGAVTTVALVGLSAIFVNNRTASTFKAATAKAENGGVTLTVSRVTSKTDEPVTWISPPNLSFESDLPGLTAEAKGNVVTLTGTAAAADPSQKKPAKAVPEAVLKLAGGDPFVVPVAPGDSADTVTTRLAMAVAQKAERERSSGVVDVWQRFTQNTVKHANTPLTNHMGLRTVLSWRPSTIGARTVENGTIDPWSRWKFNRLEKWNEAKPLFVLVMLLATLLLYLALRASGPTLWLGAALGVGIIPFGAELTNYYYCFLMGIAVLQVLRREVGMLLGTLAAITLFIEIAPIPGMSRWLDEQYAAMSVVSLLAVVGIWWCFTKWGARWCAEAEAPVDLGTLEPLVGAAGAGSPGSEPRAERKKKKKSA